MVTTNGIIGAFISFGIENKGKKPDRTVTTISKRDRIIRVGFILVYFLYILFITLFIRDVGLSRVVSLVPLSSYKKAISGSAPMLRQVLLNVGLFVPYGWLVSFALSDLEKKKRIVVAIVIIIASSVLIETLQYFTYRGQLDIDDLISNTVGGVLGASLFLLVGNVKSIQTAISLVLIVVGIVGCIYTARTKVGTDYTQYFYFRIDSVTYEDGELEFKGQCYMYEQETPKYSLILVQENLMGSRYIANVEITNQSFEASIPVNTDSKYEIIVGFSGYPQMSTGTWFRIGEKVDIEYVPGNVQIPEDIPAGAVLKAYSEKYDTYVFEVDGKILWLIGREDLASNTEIIYHIYTDEPERLPEERIQYGFDNRGFRVKKGEKHRCEIEGIGYYRVFEQAIPKEYNVNAVLVGFSTDGVVEWWKGFRI